jgi:hypothetical protein
MSCDGCKREGIFQSCWDVHVDLRSMKILCTRCFIARNGGDKGPITKREHETMLLAVGLSPRFG